MLLSDYYKLLLQDPDAPAPNSIEIDKHLADKLAYMDRISEETVREQGAVLFMNADGTIGIVDMEPGSTSGTAVNLGTATNKNKKGYMGDAHTHPYGQRMGKDARPGPSSSDLMEWFTHRPSSSPIAFHFVTSQDMQYLVAMRPEHLPDTLDMSGAPVDTDAINEPFRADIHLADQLGNAQRDLKSANTLVRAQGLVAERRLMDAHAPGVGKKFTADNLDMNASVARMHDYELYAGSGGTLQQMTAPVYKSPTRPSPTSSSSSRWTGQPPSAPSSGTHVLKPWSMRAKSPSPRGPSLGASPGPGRTK